MQMNKEYIREYETDITKKLNDALFNAGGNFDPLNLLGWGKSISQNVDYIPLGRTDYFAMLEFNIDSKKGVKILFSCRHTWGKTKSPAEVYGTSDITTDEVRSIIEKLSLQIPPKNIFKKIDQYIERMVKG